MLGIDVVVGVVGIAAVTDVDAAVVAGAIVAVVAVVGDDDDDDDDDEAGDDDDYHYHPHYHYHDHGRYQGALPCHNHQPDDQRGIMKGTLWHAHGNS